MMEFEISSARVGRSDGAETPIREPAARIQKWRFGHAGAAYNHGTTWPIFCDAGHYRTARKGYRSENSPRAISLGAQRRNLFEPGGVALPNALCLDVSFPRQGVICDA